MPRSSRTRSAFLPESGLADAGVALQQQRLAARRNVRQKRFERE
jgi:hypothetical protein